MPLSELLPFDLTPATLAVALAALVLAQWPLRWLVRRALGPLFGAETMRLARHGSTTWLRAGYAAALLLALYSSFPDRAYSDPDSIALFAHDFSELFLVIQSAAVLLLAPVWFGSAVSDEKEKRSLDFLLTTHLSSREIVLGKYFARVLSLSGLLLTGLPVLALTMLWGGVDLERVVAMFAVTFLSLLSLGAMSLFCSTMARRSVSAVAWSYAIMLAMNSCCAPFTLGVSLSPLLYQRQITEPKVDVWTMRQPPGPLDELARYAEIHGTMALVLLVLSAWQLRRRAAPEPPVRPRMRGVSLIETIPIPIPPPELPLTVWRPITGNAIVWKERFAGRNIDPFYDALWLYFAVFLGALVVPAFFSGLPELTDLLRGLFFGLAAGLTVGLCVGLLLHMAGSVSRERERRTLESLLAIPESRAAILWAKCVGGFLRRLRWALAIAAVVLLSLASGTFTPAAALMAAALAVAQSALALAIGLTASLLAGSTVRAQLAALVAAAGLIGSTVLADRYQNPQPPFPYPPRLEMREALGPVGAWGMVTRLNHSRGESSAYMTVSLGISVSVYLTAAAALGALALWQFRRLERYA